MGIIATSCMSIIAVLSQFWLRWKFYQSFLIIHIILAIVALSTILSHTLTAPCASPALSAANLHVKYSKIFVHNETVVRYFADADLLRIEMTPGVRAPFKLGPGPRLRKQCQKATDGVIRPKLLVEGPYGNKSHVYLFDTLLLFVGGTGIASAVPYILDQMQRDQEGKTSTTNIQLLWSGRQRPYLTTLPLQSFVVPSSAEMSAAPSYRHHHHHHHHHHNPLSADYVTAHGRPVVKSIIATAVEQAKLSLTSVALLVRGPATVSDDGRVLYLPP
ncbi:hypothetical protein SBRCBS47491_004562 [Sporothrix bragantina]|uniref:FAD-binding FR-type domain-containing protein n=1 Tax=Sporothrix bragantina TaxID=671064 RepID=A0ABP0BPH2_9PEZI